MAGGSEVIIPFHRPTLKEKMFFLLSGIIVSIPITVSIDTLSNFLCFLLPVFYSEICAVAIFAPFVEEFSKAYPLFYRHGETEKSIFTLGFLVGLGFGITEFILYVFVLGAPVYIRLPGVFFHATSASITAYGIATNRSFPFYLVAAILHLSYNFSTFLESFWLIGGPAVLITTYFLSWYFYNKSGNRIVY
ncbi:MAG: PrsW family glutamic-type intramembrane protease [Candidatus Methanoperedens sp.]|nr:PrsW family glutamic-type intramembrane protease [Candidatus Methanoperedens sp.]